MPFAPVIALLANALIWGLSWWPLRWLDAHGLHALWATSMAYLIPTGYLLLSRFPEMREHLRRRGFWALTVAAGLTNGAFNWGVLTGEVIRVVLLFYLMPIWALLFGRWLLGEQIRPIAVFRILLALAGAAIVLWQPGAGVPFPRETGEWLGLLGGICFALTNVLLAREAASPAPMRAMALFCGGLLIPGLLALLLSAAGRISPPPTPDGMWILGLLGLSAALVVGNTALSYGAARLPAQLTALIMLTEVIFASLSALWLAGEALDTRTALGGGLILLTALLASRRPKPSVDSHRLPA